MKQLVHPVLAVVFTSALVGCSQQTTENNAPKTPAVTEAKKKEEGQEQDLHTVQWSYTGDEGPEFWGTLDPSYAVCVDGSEQSPINIELPAVKTSGMIESVDTHYEPSSFSIINNGHTIQANTVSENNKMVLEGAEYRLVQFHFHTPSEHEFNGEQYAMELHLVHQDENGKLAVLGVMIQEGEINNNLQAIWDMLPGEKTEEEIAMDAPLDLGALLPEDQAFFHYNGSLTTPPCTEDVEWVVFEQPIEMSKEQIEAFQQIFPDNHRPVQPINAREVVNN
ncbi:MAG: carbonic anhydrase [Lysinibacillus sp.]